MLPAAVFGVIVLVALFDVVVGLRLLFSARPFLVNGRDALWAHQTPPLWDGEAGELLRSLYRRLGAFSFHTGVITVVWTWLGRHEPRLLTVLLVVYTLTGVTFFANDRAYFQRTRYLRLKQGLGALWAGALLTHLLSGGA